MEAEIGGIEPSNKIAVTEMSDRSRSSNRMLYEAQAKAIRQQIGELEEVREKLGLSQRKICQLLMVDPSAWNRWTHNEGEAPPHIWRALQWYFALKKELPGINESYFLGHEFRLRDQDAQKSKMNQVLLQIQHLNEEISLLKSKNQNLQQNFDNYHSTINKKKKRLIYITLVSGIIFIAIALLLQRA